jgi:DNA-directed RNA polymerase specialized sigma24 family protein
MTSTKDQNFCVPGGYLVGGTSRIGDTYQFQVEGLHEVVGCARLRCSACHADVRNVVGLALGPNTFPREAYAIIGAERPDELVVSSPRRRLYCCNCTAWLEASQTCTNPPPPHDALDHVFPWRCAGHPRLQSSSAGADQLAHARHLLEDMTPARVPRSRNADLLKVMWAAADDTLKGMLESLFQAAFKDTRGLVLARALAIVECDARALGVNILGLNPNDSRLSENDPTREGWLLRDRLASSLATYLHETNDWSGAGTLATQVVRSTTSKILLQEIGRLEQAVTENATPAQAGSNLASSDVDARAPGRPRIGDEEAARSAVDGATKTKRDSDLGIRFEGNSLTVTGTITGHLIAKERIHLKAGARVKGLLEAPSVVIQAGAQFEGHIDMDILDALKSVAPKGILEQSSSLRRDRLDETQAHIEAIISKCLDRAGGRGTVEACYEIESRARSYIAESTGTSAALPNLTARCAPAENVGSEAIICLLEEPRGSKSIRVVSIAARPQRAFRDLLTGRLGQTIPHSNNDPNLIERIRSGDGLAFELVFKRYQKRVREIIAKETNNDDLIQDMVHFVFADMYRALTAPTTSTKQSLKDLVTHIAWYRVAYSKRQSWFYSGNSTHRGRTRRAGVSLTESLKKSIDGLPTADWRSFLLHEVHSLTFREIAVALGVGEESVRDQFRRAARHLGPALELHNPVNARDQQGDIRSYGRAIQKAADLL